MSDSEASPAEQPAPPATAPAASAGSSPSPSQAGRKEELLPVGEKISLGGASESHDESSGAKDEKTETPAEDDATNKGVKEGSPSDE